jgi:hypothetical protein
MTANFGRINAKVERILVVQHRKLMAAYRDQRTVQPLNVHRDVVREAIVNVAHVGAHCGVLFFGGGLRRGRHQSRSVLSA